MTYAFLSLLLAVSILSGCVTTDQGVTTPETEVLAKASELQPSTDTVSLSVTTDAPLETEVPSTPEPTPEPTATPVPTDTPEPNLFLGSWTVDGLPFLLDVRSDGTYTVSTGDAEATGSYIYTGSDLTLLTENGEDVVFKYYYKTDKIMHDSYVLVRGEIETAQIVSKVPTTFTNENEAMSVSVRGAVVDVQLKNDVLAKEYCFTDQGLIPPEDSCDWFSVTDSGEPTAHFRAYKYDGEYTLWVRDTEDNTLDTIDVTVVSGFNYPIQAKGLEPVRHALKTVLEENQTSVKNLNAQISTDIAAAGLYTREGVVTSGVSLISHMSEIGYSIVYQGSGSYQAENNWGVNPEWGSKLDKPTSDANGTYYYTGMQCVASIVWAYKQAGMNLFSKLRSEIGRVGEHTRTNDNKIKYDRAKSGDIVRSGGHYLMVIDRLDQNNDGVCDAYLTYEMWAPHLTILVLTFKQVKGRTFYSMDAFFDGTGHNTSKAVYWDDTFRIPTEALPQYLHDALEYEETEQAFTAFKNQFGL